MLKLETKVHWNCAKMERTKNKQTKNGKREKIRERKWWEAKMKDKRGGMKEIRKVHKIETAFLSPEDVEIFVNTQVRYPELKQHHWKET